MPIKKKIIWMLVSFFMVISLVIASCGEEEEEEEEEPTGRETVQVKVTGLDGTQKTVTKEKPEYGGTLARINELGYTSFDPNEALLIRVGYAQVSGNELMQGKWEIGPTGTGDVDWLTGFAGRYELMTGELAESWELPDDETIIYNLRKGIHFWDKEPVNGRELVADDVVWWLKEAYTNTAMWQNMGYPPESGQAPTSYKALDDYTVEIKIPAKGQGIGLLEMGDNAYTYPKEIWTEYGGIGSDWTKVVASGPFMLVDYVADSVATYARNPNYFESDPYFPENRLPYVDTYKELIIADASAQQAAIRTAKIDFMKRLTYEDAQLIMKQCPDIEYSKRIFGSGTVVAGRIGAPPFDDLRVRQAMNLAVNQQEILDTFYNGDGELIAWPMPPGKNFEPYYTAPEDMPEEVTMLFTYDVEKAKQLMADAGYPDGFKTKCIVRNQPLAVDYVSLIKEYLLQIGIDFDIETIETTAYFAMMSNKAQKAGEMMAGNPIFAPDQPLSIKPRQFENFAWVDDRYYDKLIKSIGEDIVANPDVFQKNVKDAAVYMLGTAFGIWSPNPYSYNLYWPWLKEYHGIDGTGWHNVSDFAKYLWIDQDMKKTMGY